MLVPTAANGQPAFAAYARADDGSFQAHAIQVLTVDAGQVARIVSFNDGRLLAAFGLPDTPTGSVRPVRHLDAGIEAAGPNCIGAELADLSGRVEPTPVRP
jgi:hypothetical protein